MMKAKWIGIGILLILLAFFHFRGLSIHDGGYIINSAQKLLWGQQIYRDYDFVYTPGSVLLVASVFKLFGSSIFIERILAFTISILTIFVLYKLLKHFNAPFLILVSTIFVFIFWGPTHINFVSPVMLSILTGISTMLFFSQSFIRKNSLIYAGLCTGLTFLWKQNFGVALMIVGLFFYILNRKRFTFSQFVLYIEGVFVPLFGFLLYLLLTNSFSGYIHNVWFYTIKNIILEQKLTTPFLYGSNFYQVFLKTIWYTLPLWTTIVTGLLMLKKHHEYLFIHVWIILYYLVSIRPETDFIHLVPILSITGISFIFIDIAHSALLKKIVIVFLVTLIGVGIYTSLFMGYYRWENPLITNNFFNIHTHVRIWTDQRWNKIINILNSTITQNTDFQEHIYVHGNAPLLYYLAKRKNATRYDFIIPYTLTDSIQNEIINDLNSKNVRYIITEKSDDLSTITARQILYNYSRIQSVDQFIIWKKNLTIKEF